MMKYRAQYLLYFSCFAYLVVQNRCEIIQRQVDHDNSSHLSHVVCTKQYIRTRKTSEAIYNRSYNFILPSDHATNRSLQSGSVVRINCGSTTDWTDPTTGLKWLADNFYSTGGTFNNCPLLIADTESDNLFCSHRSFSGSSNTKGFYSIPVSPGLYSVKVMFAEIFFDKPQKRVFQVIVQDKTLTSALDVYTTVGKDKAYVIDTIVDVSQNTGVVTVSLVNVIENSMISAIEITPVAIPVQPSSVSLTIRGPDVPAIRINCGSTAPWTDPSTGFTWDADKYNNGGGTYSACPTEIATTEQDNLYCCHRSFFGGKNSVGSYTIPVQPGQYKVKLMFAEVFFDSPNKRAFKVSVQGKVLQESIDLTGSVGTKTAYDLTTTVTVNSGTTAIMIDLTNLIENSMISGIEIIPLFASGSPDPGQVPVSVPVPALPSPAFPSVRINCGASTSWIDPSTGQTWGPDSFSDGGGTYNGCPGLISGTDKSALLCDHRSFYGAGGSYNIPVQPGQYTVNLLFAEVFFNKPNQRVFKVSIQGMLLVPSLDLIMIVGEKAAYSLTSTVIVDTSTPVIKIELAAVVENPIISAIEIIPVTKIVTPPLPSPAQVPLPVTTTPLSSFVPTTRINCGATAPWTDPSTGFTWNADTYSDGGGIYSACPMEIAGTEQDNLYCSHHCFFGGINSVGSYTIPVQPGQYRVNLMFAEVFFTNPNKRVFKVSVQGKVLQQSVDVTASMGAKTAYLLTSTVTVDTGTTSIKIELTNLIENSMISGIEIIPLFANGIVPVSVPVPVRVPVVAPVPAPAVPTITTPSKPVQVPTPDFLVNGRWTITDINAAIEARHEACFVMAGRKAVLIGGRGKRRPNIYDPVTKTWTTGTLPPNEIELNHFQCVSIKGKVWIVAAFTGGFPNESNAPFTYVYDPVADKWQTRDPMPLNRRRGSTAVVAVGDLIYVSHGNIGGHETDNHAVSLGWLDVYNTTSDEWKVLADAKYPRDHTGGALVNGKICVGGGRDGGTILWPEVPQTECYDIATNTWSLNPNVLQMRAGAAYGTSCDGKLLMAGGEGFGKAFTQFDMFDGTKWTKLADLNIGRHGTGLAVDCVCNAIYIASGNGQQGGGMEITSVETFSLSDKPCLA